MTSTSDRWVYNGDGNLEYGGSFIDLSTWADGYCSAVRVTDLDSGCGFRGAVEVQHVTIVHIDRAESIRNALRSCGCFPFGPRRENESPADRKQSLRHAIADALLSYGCYDPEDNGGFGPQTEVLQLEADGPMTFDGWRASKRLRGGDLLGYVRAVHLQD